MEKKIGIEEILKALGDLVVERNVKCPLYLSGISDNSKKVFKGYVFVAIKGHEKDGHNYIQEAVKREASLIIHEKAADSIGAPHVLVKDSRKALGVLSSLFFGNPSKRLKLVGVTGTNGKSSTVFLLEKLFNLSGILSGSIGTLGITFEGKTTTLPNTTPDPITVNKALSYMAEKGAQYAFMEVSSHSIHQKRIYGLHFYSGIFTKGGRDHLDYHKSLKEYKETKKSFFREYTDRVFVNIDDPWGLEIERECKEMGKTVVTLSIRSKKGTYRVEDYKLGDSLTEGTFTREDSKLFHFNSRLVGRYNLYNILNALSFATEEGIKPEKLTQAIEAIPPVPGRMEPVGSGVFLDYAHTPDALKELLKSLREIGRGKIIVVFGCGGNRDRGKRPKMGRIAEKLADIVLVTSDNPRKEDPMMIIDDIVEGMEKRVLSEKEIKKTRSGVFTNPDRRWMIEFSLRLKGENDIVVVAGKGHENYMELGGKKIEYSDREVIKEKGRKVFGRRWK